MAERIVQNRTPEQVIIRGREKAELRLAPFEERKLTDQDLEPFDQQAMRHGGHIDVRDAEERHNYVLGALPYAGVAYFIVGVNVDRIWFWLVGAAVIIASLVVGLFATLRGPGEVLRWLKQSASLVLAIGVGLALPAAFLWYATDLSDAGVPVSRVVDVLDSSASARLFMGRALQWLFIVIAALLPALMFFLFDRAQLATLRDRFVHEVFRFDPAMEHLGDLETRYGRQMSEGYGTTKITGSARLISGRRSPVVIATILFTLGWTLVLLNRDVTGIVPGSVPVAFASFDFIDLFVPERSVVTFAFLGAYFFGLQLATRGYLRGDLRPKTYTQMTVRVLQVVLLGWVLDLALPDDSWGLLGAAFLAGIFPEAALRNLGNAIQKVTGGLGGGILEDSASLTHLEGIDIYDRNRLEGEGVTNVEGLAHHDVVDLMLVTRIPAPRLVDWVDQAILYLHTTSRKGSEIQVGTDKEEDSASRRISGHGDARQDAGVRHPDGYGSHRRVRGGPGTEGRWR